MAKNDPTAGDAASKGVDDDLGPYGDEAVTIEKAAEDADLDDSEPVNSEPVKTEDDSDDDSDEEEYEFLDTDGDGIPDKFEVGEDDPSPQTTLFWTAARIDPVEVALPNEVGLTLRHYRIVTDDDDNEAEEAVFLAHEGTLHLFRTAEGLVEFINSDAPHDLTKVTGWADVRRLCAPSDVVADEEDRYELDLVVENLRGGHDVWEADLLVPAGEFARDAAFACGLKDVLAALAPGSPLDELDEAIRDGGFLARRRLKKIGAEQAAIGWRSIIGKISAAITWHD